MVNNQCMYFETTRMNHQNAKMNCVNKMKGYGKGRLVEMTSASMNKAVAEKAAELDFSSWFHIGVNDSVQHGTYIYESNSVPISLNPDWYDAGNFGPYYDKESHKCVMVMGSRHMWGDRALGKWLNYDCSPENQSVCE